jgi:hypothetical protein
MCDSLGGTSLLLNLGQSLGDRIQTLPTTLSSTEQRDGLPLVRLDLPRITVDAKPRVSQ